MPKQVVALSLDNAVAEELKRQADEFGYNVSAYISQLVAYVYQYPGKFERDPVTGALVDTD